MTGRNNGSGPAFPTSFATGLTKREFFAALAMHAELSTAGQHAGAAMALVKAAEKAGQTIEQRIAFNAYQVADAMVAASGGTQS